MASGADSVPFMQFKGPFAQKVCSMKDKLRFPDASRHGDLENGDYSLSIHTKCMRVPLILN